MSLFSCKWDFLFIFFDGLNFIILLSVIYKSLPFQLTS